MASTLKDKTRPAGAPRLLGFVLLPVVLALTVVGAMALLLIYEGGLNSQWITSDTEARQAEYLAEAAIAHANWSKDNLGCIGDVTIPSTALGSHSYAATIDSSASTAVHNFLPDRDAEIHEASPDATFGGNPELAVQNASGDGRRALFHFDVSSVAAGTRVAEATLWLYATANDDLADLSIHPMTAAWSEGSATWNTLASSFESSILGTVPLQSQPNVWVKANLTNLVQAWVNEPAGNYGIMLLARSTKESRYTSRDHGTAALRPYLEVITADANVSPVTITATGTLANGVTRTRTQSATKVHQKPIMLTQQPGANSKDAYVTDRNNDSNKGTSTELAVKGSGQKQVILIEFDLATIPARAKTLSATLSLFGATSIDLGSGAEVNIYRLTEPWTEGGVTYQTSDGTTPWTWPDNYDASNPISTVVPAGVGYWDTWDVTPVVRGWLDGQYVNRGFVLVPNGMVYYADYYSGEFTGDPMLRPKLTLRYACECGSACLAPQGSGNVVLVVQNTSNPDPADEAIEAQFEDWGYTVDLIAASASQAGFDAKMANNDVAYVSETVLEGSLGTKLKSATIGVVYEQGLLNDEFGMASGANWLAGDAINIVDNTHYITRVFPAGSLSIKTARSELLTVGGSEAPGLQALADFGGAGSLVVLDQGAEVEGGGTASGRRVMLPLGGDAGYNWEYLNSNGRLMVQRALRWAGGNTGNGCSDGAFRDEFTTAAFNNDDGSLTWSGDWLEVDSGGAGPDAGKARIVGGELRLNGTPQPVNDPSLTREFDLSGHLSAVLSFGFGTDSGVEAGEDSAVVEISGDGGSSWTVLEDFINLGPNASGSRQYDITPYISADTQVRFRINAAYGGPSEYFYVDNLEIAGSCAPTPPGLGPVAHWKLDEGSGVLATDWADGHDGTVSGATWTTGKLDGGLLFDDASDVVTVPHSNELSFSGAITLAGWANNTTLDFYDLVVAKSNTGTHNGNYWLGTVDRDITFGFTVGGGFLEFNTSGLNLQANTWYHLAATFDDTTGEVRIYLNGTEVYSATTTMSPDACTGPVTLGGALWAGVDPWDGSIDDVRIYDRVLSAIEITALAGGGGGCAGAFRDEFNARTYDGSDGTLSWTGPWEEVGESNGPTSGDEQVVNDESDYQLRLQDNDNGGEGVEREADLSGYSAATLTFDYRRQGLDSEYDYVAIAVSADGGGTWAELDRLQGPATDAGYQSTSYDISAHIAANTRIRFLGSSYLGGSDIVFFDNVEICVGH